MKKLVSFFKDIIYSKLLRVVWSICILITILGFLSNNEELIIVLTIPYLMSCYYAAKFSTKRENI